MAGSSLICDNKYSINTSAVVKVAISLIVVLYIVFKLSGNSSITSTTEQQQELFEDDFTVTSEYPTVVSNHADDSSNDGDNDTGGDDSEDGNVMTTNGDLEDGEESDPSEMTKTHKDHKSHKNNDEVSNKNALREKLEKIINAKYDILVNRYRRKGKIPRTKECNLKFQEKMKLEALNISGCNIQGDMCSVRRGTPIHMTAAFLIHDSMEEVDVNKISFKIEGKIIGIWTSNPFYHQKSLCTGQLKDINCIWKSKKLLLKIAMDPVPRFVLMSEVASRVQTMYGKQVAACFSQSIKLSW